MMKSFLVFALVMIFAGSCFDSKTKEDNLPPSSGPSGFMYLVMDSTQHKGPLGMTMDSILHHQMPGLPRKEPIFHVRWIDPRKLNFVLRQGRNLIYAVTLDQRGSGAGVIKNSFTQKSIDAIRKDTSFYITTSKNVDAKNQEVMYLFSNTEEQLIQKVRRNAKKIIAHFNRTELERLSSSLYKSGQVAGIPALLRQKYQCEIKIPFGYQLVIDTPNFLWARQINPKDDRDIFVARSKYASKLQFNKDSLVLLRNRICRQYIFGNPEKPDSYLTTEQEYQEVELKEITFNGHYAVEIRGLWLTNTRTMGGPFVAYALVDDLTGSFYYIEGFTYSPGRDQREIIRELETILYSFKTSAQIQKAQPNS